MDKPRNAEEQAFWDAAAIAALGGAMMTRDLGGEHNAAELAERAAFALLERRRRIVEAFNASP